MFASSAVLRSRKALVTSLQASSISRLSLGGSSPRLYLSMPYLRVGDAVGVDRRVRGQLAADRQPVHSGQLQIDGVGAALGDGGPRGAIGAAHEQLPGPRAVPP